MSKLSKLISWLDVARIVLPPTLVAAGLDAEQAQQITQTVGEAEGALGPGTGTEKLQHVLNGIGTTMKASGASDTTIQAVQDMAASGIATGITITNRLHQLHSVTPVPTSAIQ